MSIHYLTKHRSLSPPASRHVIVIAGSPKNDDLDVIPAKACPVVAFEAVTRSMYSHRDKYADHAHNHTGLIAGGWKYTEDQDLFGVLFVNTFFDGDDIYSSNNIDQDYLADDYSFHTRVVPCHWPPEDDHKHLPEIMQAVEDDAIRYAPRPKTQPTAKKAWHPGDHDDMDDIDRVLAEAIATPSISA